jgi:hypothetical protein
VRDVLPGKPDQKQQEGRPEEHEHTAAAASGRACEARCCQDEQRQGAVEDGFDCERPGRADPDHHRARVVVLQKQGRLD